MCIGYHVIFAAWFWNMFSQTTSLTCICKHCIYWVGLNSYNVPACRTQNAVSSRTVNFTVDRTDFFLYISSDTQQFQVTGTDSRLAWMWHTAVRGPQTLLFRIGHINLQTALMVFAWNLFSSACSKSWMKGWLINIELRGVRKWVN